MEQNKTQGKSRLCRVMKSAVMMMVMMVTAVCMSSCERDDDDIAYNLNGTWKGKITSIYNGSSSGREYDAVLIFDQTGYSNHGYGYEEDGSWRYSSRVHFEWVVEKGCIYLSYDDGTSVVMDYNGSMPYGNTGDVLRGSFRDQQSGEKIAAFWLQKTSNSSDY